MPEFNIRLQDGTTTTYALEGRRITLGRALGNDLQFATDPALSRTHLAVAPMEGGWWVEDLGSRNGTKLNGVPLASKRRLQNGDAVEVGTMVLTFVDAPAQTGGDKTVIFTAPKGSGEPLHASVQLRLTEAIEDSTHLEKAFLRSSPEAAAARLQALFTAGRELAGQRPLEDLFPMILKLAADAVGAERGVVMTTEDGVLITRAARGADFRISTAVRDRVVGNRESLLIHDVASDEALRESKTIIAHRVRTLLAVPLQTDEKVIGLLYLDSTRGRPFNPDDLTLLTVLSNIAAIRIEHQRLIELEQAERIMQAELRQAAEIQQGLLPKQDPNLDSFDIAGKSEPCRTVNGDYYDYLPLLDGRLLLICGDVAGKGISAALLLSALQARVHTIAEEGLPIETIISRLNNGICANMPGNRFVTMFASILDPLDGTLTFTNAGHNPPLHMRASGEAEPLMEGGPVLGVLKMAPYDKGCVALNPGDVVVMYTDGVTEATSASGEEFGEDRLAAVVRANRFAPAAQIVKAVREAVLAHLGDQPAADDVTVVVVKRM